MTDRLLESHEMAERITAFSAPHLVKLLQKMKDCADHLVEAQRLADKFAGQFQAHDIGPSTADGISEAIDQTAWIDCDLQGEIERLSEALDIYFERVDERGP